MSDKEILAIVQARIDGKRLEKHNLLVWTEWQDVDETEALNFEKYEYRVKKENKLPKTWEDYCAQNFTTQQDYLRLQMPFIGSIEQIGACSKTCLYSDAFVALAKLVMLRDCYNSYQTPPFSGVRHSISVRNKNGELTVVPLCSKTFSSNNKNYRPMLLRFHTPQLRDTFMKNFNDLILEAAEILV